MTEQPKPSMGDALANLRGADRPWQAARGFLTNSWIKLRKRDNCCGNYGDPGC